MTEPPAHQPQPGYPPPGYQPGGYQPPGYQSPSPHPAPAAYGPASYQPQPYQPGGPIGPTAPPAIILSSREVGRRRAWPALLALVLVAAGAFVALRLRHDSGPGYPKHWDPRVQAAVNFVEQDRGLKFKHPVQVEFLTPAAFVRRVTGGSDSAADTSSLANTAAELAATGLAPAGLDLSKALKQFRGSSVLGYYEFSSRHIVVRGSTLSPAATVTVVHELTHALQDQYYGIGRKGAEIARADAGTPNTGVDDGFHAVVEGDARRVEGDYVRSLSPSDRAAVMREEDGERTTAGAAIKDIPQALVAMQEVPYDLGRAMVDYQRQADGAGSEDNLFQRWPSSDMQILQPWRYVNGDTAVTLPPVSLPSGLRAFDRGTMGSISWFFILAERLGPARALAAVDAWAGDSFAAYRDGGRACVQARVKASSAAGLAAMRTGFRAWAGTVPALAPTVSTSGGELRVRSCAPARGAKLAVPNRTGAALGYATNRVDLATALLRLGATADAAPCIATRLLRRLPVSALVGSHVTPRTQRIVAQARAACG